MTNSIILFVHHPTTISNELETVSSSLEVFASELPENLEEMFPQYYMHSDMFSIFKFLTTQYCVMISTIYGTNKK